MAILDDQFTVEIWRTETGNEHLKVLIKTSLLVSHKDPSNVNWAIFDVCMSKHVINFKLVFPNKDAIEDWECILSTIPNWKVLPSVVILNKTLLPWKCGNGNLKCGNAEQNDVIGIELIKTDVTDTSDKVNYQNSNIHQQLGIGNSTV
ncbi:hypothetical protein CAPTEDRAFT_222524 [Capitella teleta]|uniref:Uncharacterized protein n=1 Tax=Capitella teleta TaxID=283909 RepID=R7VH65_CAPTE|nr:hypothetical protein CAPTEDRAFT_222524 [Capitella teleta]|eukprot:ELU17917.1 hypothetical protein CAPTEDRAFT_222524 [Capitella teleta]